MMGDRPLEYSLGVTSMFEWLEEEIRSVRTPHFHEVDGPAPPDLRSAVEQSPVALPPSYKEFVLRFGNVKLYRYSHLYWVRVYAAPRQAESARGEPLLNFGRTAVGFVYFKEALLLPGGESPVFEYCGPEFGWRRTAKGFEQWIRKECNAARRQFKKRGEWEAILQGPAPFTEQEEAIVEARKHFLWRVVGISDNGDLRFEVRNDSSLILPFLTVGVRHKGGEVFGGIKLPVSGIRPGQTAIIEIDCYKKTHDPHKVEPFQEPDPEPALRDLYWEFKELGLISGQGHHS
jgi:hypothetical protein